MKRPAALVPGSKKLVLVGVMTAAKYLNTRAVAAYETWIKTIPGKVLFFSSEGSEKLLPPSFPVVGLPGVDDTYPPQKKSFLMLKYMHEYHGDEYEWFMRIDDDNHVVGQRLETFLRSINSTVPLFLGQAGLGNREERGLMALDERKPYCMGGPGMALTAETLRRFIPHITQCLANLVTNHEDVELGRCITKFSGATCSYSFEVSQSSFMGYCIRSLLYAQYMYLCMSPLPHHYLTLVHN